ncbi:hypothetical protein [Streptomonospora salina]|uniref:Uncharacterized protein n=1 Tax=Streptomonospora salina TaxID=104205 RepID=A0A841EA40_9ACTN|nr:hypothetical protein [Streptomonospora salina]MBB5996321.1 hypothetical protein [Streptomonospora salina]
MSLHEADPRQLGPFRLTERVAATPEGVVYGARDSRGRRVSIAMLSSGAAADPAARDRFAAAVGRGRGLDRPPAVVASSLSSPAASWVAVRHAGGRGAEAYLEPVAAGGDEAERGTAAAAPSYAPYWAESGATPAAAAWSWAMVGLRRLSGSYPPEPARAGARAGRGPVPSAAVPAPAAGPPPAAVRRRAWGGWPTAAALLVVLLLVAAVVTAVYLLLYNVTAQATPPPPPTPAPESSPDTGSGTEPGATQDPTAPPSPGGVPSVEVDEDDHPPGEAPAGPEDQA